jgi:hypothetical protein
MLTGLMIVALASTVAAGAATKAMHKAAGESKPVMKQESKAAMKKTSSPW